MARKGVRKKQGARAKRLAGKRQRRARRAEKRAGKGPAESRQFKKRLQALMQQAEKAGIKPDGSFKVFGTSQPKTIWVHEPRERRHSISEMELKQVLTSLGATSSETRDLTPVISRHLGMVEKLRGKERTEVLKRLLKQALADLRERKS